MSSDLPDLPRSTYSDSARDASASLRRLWTLWTRGMPDVIFAHRARSHPVECHRRLLQSEGKRCRREDVARQYHRRGCSMTTRQLPRLAALAVLLASAATAAPGPQGVWLSEDGDGAVALFDCAEHLCGRVVW